MTLQHIENPLLKEICYVRINVHQSIQMERGKKTQI